MLDRMLGRNVLAPNGRRIGRLEEFRSQREGQGWTVTECVIGAAGLWERLGLGARLLIGRKPRGFIARWDQLVFDDDRPVRLTCRLEELRSL
jgi:hypothetical protein